ncbi:MAG: Trp biosynthesis-associated membrane protein [Dermatophilaceae bacterium]
MIDALTTKRMVLLLVLVSAVAILVSGSREWVSGSIADAVLGETAVHGKGSDVAPVALAAALVGLASAVAVATAGRVVRLIAACAALLAAVLGAVVVIGVLADPAGALGRLAAAGTGRTGTVATQSSVGVWAWVALAATLFMGVGGFASLIGGRRWSQLSSTYDAPVADVASRQDSTGQPVSSNDSAWDQLSRGEDPTVEH